MTLDLVLFDVDDTLCDYAGARAIRLRHAFTAAFAARSTGRIDDPVDLDRLIAESAAMQPHGTDHFPELLGRFGVAHDVITSTRQWYQTNRFLGLQLFPDAVETLAHARGSGRGVGLITNGPADVQRAKLDLLGLRAHVDFALISGELGIAKPDPAIFHEALRLAGKNAEEALYIGDSPEFDFAGARAAGIRSVWVNRAGAAWDHAQPSPNHEVRDLTALHPLLV